jgi:predicted neutral ceramidase superfamily lipid hydrolase
MSHIPQLVVTLIPIINFLCLLYLFLIYIICIQRKIKVINNKTLFLPSLNQRK